MKLIEATHVELEALDFAAMSDHEAQPYQRVSELGVTTILRDMAIILGKISATSEEAVTLPLRMLVGMGWESSCVSLYNDIYWQPGVFVAQGISGHPDGFSAEVSCIEEFKYTHYTSRPNKHPRDILSMWIWLQQVMGYANILNRGYGYEIRQARLHVCYGLGDYQRPYKELYMRYRVEFDIEDLNRNWQMLQQHKENMLSKAYVS